MGIRTSMTAGLEGAAVDDGEAAEVMATLERIFRARAVSLANQRAIHQRRIEQLREESAGLAGELEAQDRRRALLAEELEGVRSWSTGPAVHVERGCGVVR